jgi:hypothetical protein
MTSVYQNELSEVQRKQITLDPGNDYERCFANSFGLTIAIITSDKKMIFGRRGNVIIFIFLLNKSLRKLQFEKTNLIVE